MRHAGALRIDHVMGLRLCIDSRRFTAHCGCLCALSLETLLRILAPSHSATVHRHRRDPAPYRGSWEASGPAGLLAYRVLYFERWPDGLFKRADTHPELSLVTVATHDLPTLAGWWLGRDIDLRCTGTVPGRIHEGR
ncbi:MAG: 4-alpha-glucanotransferase [Candidatus Competibacteraceae bacterium]